MGLLSNSPMPGNNTKNFTYITSRNAYSHPEAGITICIFNMRELSYLLVKSQSKYKREMRVKLRDECKACVLYQYIHFLLQKYFLKEL